MVTNQPNIARGSQSRENVYAINHYLQDLLRLDAAEICDMMTQIIATAANLNLGCCCAPPHATILLWRQVFWWATVAGYRGRASRRLPISSLATAMARTLHLIRMSWFQHSAKPPHGSWRKTVEGAKTFRLRRPGGRLHIVISGEGRPRLRTKQFLGLTQTFHRTNFIESAS